MTWELSQNPLLALCVSSIWLFLSFIFHKTGIVSTIIETDGIRGTTKFVPDWSEVQMTLRLMAGI